MAIVIPPYQLEQQGWLLLNKGGEQSYGGNDGYHNKSSEFYTWDSTVPHHAEIMVGDLVIVWDGTTTVYGMSVIDHIECYESTKILNSCPDCGRRKIDRRKSVAPAWRCASRTCHAEFETPISTIVPVTVSRAEYQAAWREMTNVSAQDLKQLAKSPKSIQSLRPLNLELFDGKFPTYRSDLAAWSPQWQEETDSGHRRILTRVRIGQQKFREKLIRQFGSLCAFTGPNPKASLEAAHLYSYATAGTHHTHGGLLIRRDVHALFDRHLIAVDPRDWSIAVARELSDYSNYRALHRRKLQVELSDGHRRWLHLRWQYAKAHNEYLTP